MREQITPLSRAISDVLTGAYAKKRLTQEELAERAEMSIWTLQKKLKGRSHITATDLVLISRAIGVDPAAVLNEAISDVERAAGALSEGDGTVDPIDNVTYLGHVTPELADAADEKGRTPSRD